MSISVRIITSVSIKQVSSVFSFLLDGLRRTTEPEKISTSKEAEPQSYTYLTVARSLILLAYYVIAIDQ